MKSYFPQLRAISACICLAAPTALFAQQLTADNSLPGASASPAVSSPTVLTQPATAPAQTRTWESSVDRWLDLHTWTFSGRYRSVFAEDGAHDANQGQHRSIVDGKFKFDENGRYGLAFHLSTGHYFNWAYADFVGGGQAYLMDSYIAKVTNPMLSGAFSNSPAGFYRSAGTAMYFRQAFLTAEPVKGLEAQFGGLGIERGVNTEATSFDDDGYITGERLNIRRPQNLFLSQISYTRAYMGDYWQPNFFARGERLSSANYSQYLIRKDFGKRLAVSSDFTTQVTAVKNMRTVREAILGDIHESRVLDSVRFEFYQRLDSDGVSVLGAGNGYAWTLAKNDIVKRVGFEGGIANIDIHYFTLLALPPTSYGEVLIMGLAPNGDQYGVGERFFVRPSVQLTPYLKLVGNYNHLFHFVGDGIESPWNRQLLEAGFVLDAKKLFFHSPAVH